MEEFEIAHVGVRQASRGLEVIDLYKRDTPYYQFQKGSSMTAVATLPYCPDCSEVYEFRKGQVGPKWAMEPTDYEFRLAYKTDDEGVTFAYCTRCKRDMREPLFNETVLEPKVEIPTLKEIYINGVFYQNGRYWMEVSDFKAVMIQHREGVKVQLCFIHQNGDVKRMKNEAFSNAKNLEIKDGKMGVKAHLWE